MNINHKDHTIKDLGQCNHCSVILSPNIGLSLLQLPLPSLHSLLHLRKLCCHLLPKLLRLCSVKCSIIGQNQVFSIFSFLEKVRQVKVRQMKVRQVKFRQVKVTQVKVTQVKARQVKVVQVKFGHVKVGNYHT